MRPASLQARLLIAVGGLALAAIGMVVLAARHRTRLEFLRFADAAAPRGVVALSALARRLAGELDDAAATPSPARLAAAARRRRPGAGRERHPHRDCRCGRQPGTQVTARRDHDTLALEIARRDGPRVSQTMLQFRGAPDPLRLADGRAASLYVLPLPADDGNRPEEVFFGALDRRLLLAAARSSACWP